MTSHTRARRRPPIHSVSVVVALIRHRPRTPPAHDAHQPGARVALTAYAESDGHQVCRTDR